MEATKMYTLITGGTSGIGFELAKIFAYNGYNLILVARNENELQRAYKEFTLIGVDVITYAAR